MKHHVRLPRPTVLRTETPWLLLVLAASTVTLLRSHLILGSAMLAGPVLLVSYVLAIAWLLPSHPRRSLAARPLFFLGLAFVLWTGATGVRGGIVGAYGSVVSTSAEAFGLFAVFMFAALLLSSARTHRQMEERLVALALAPAVYCMVNVVLFLAGIAPATEQTGLAAGTSGTLLSPLGINVTRSSLPLAGAGINSMGIVAGIGLVASALLGVKRAIPLGIAVLAVGASFYCLVLSDTRMALAMAVVVVVLYIVRPTWSTRWAAVLVFALPVVTQLLFSDAFGGFAEAFARSAQDLGTANGRVYIWDGVREFLSSWSPQQIVGWGAGGQISSGASMRYAYYFRSQLSPTGYTAHSLTLQTILDGGYVSLLLLASNVWYSGRSLVRRARGASFAATALLGTIWLLVVTGATESSPGYGQETMVILASLLGGAAGADSFTTRVGSEPLEPADVRRASVHHRHILGRLDVVSGGQHA